MLKIFICLWALFIVPVACLACYINIRRILIEIYKKLLDDHAIHLENKYEKQFLDSYDKITKPHYETDKDGYTYEKLPLNKLEKIIMAIVILWGYYYCFSNFP